MDINLDDLTLGDLEEIEDITGTPAGKLMSGDGLTVKALRAVVFVAKRRDDPTFTYEDTAGVRLSEFNVTQATDPTDAAS